MRIEVVHRYHSGEKYFYGNCSMKIRYQRVLFSNCQMGEKAEEIKVQMGYN